MSILKEGWLYPSGLPRDDYRYRLVVADELVHMFQQAYGPAVEIIPQSATFLPLMTTREMLDGDLFAGVNMRHWYALLWCALWCVLDQAEGLREFNAYCRARMGL